MLSQKILSPASNASFQQGPPASKPASRDVLCCLVVDTTLSLKDHFKTLQQSFLAPFLSQLRLPVPIDFEGQPTKFTPSLKLGVVTYSDYVSSNPVTSHYFTSEHKLVLDHLNSLKFDTGGPCHSVVYEGLCSALEMFDDYQESFSSESKMEPIRHCILIGNSLPYTCNIKFNQREENDNLSVHGVCQKLKKHNVNFSIISTNKLLEPLYSIPNLVNSETVPVLDYFRAGYDNYVAKLAGILPPDSFKVPGWLKIVNIKEKRKIKDFDADALTDIKRTKSKTSESSASSFTRPQDVSKPFQSGPTPPAHSTPIQNINSAPKTPRTPNTADGQHFPGSQPVASPAASELYSTPLANNHVGESSPSAAKLSTTPQALNSTVEALSSEPSAMRRQSSSRGGRGGSRKPSVPKKLTKAQLKAQAKAAASNSPLSSSVPNPLSTSESQPLADPAQVQTQTQTQVTVPQVNNNSIPSQLPQDSTERAIGNIPPTTPSSINVAQQIPASIQTADINSIKSPGLNLPVSMNQGNTPQSINNQTPGHVLPRSPLPASTNMSADHSVPMQLAHNQQPPNYLPNQSMPPNVAANPSTAIPQPQNTTNNPPEAARNPTNTGQRPNPITIPGQTQNPAPGTGPARQPQNPVWQGLIRSKGGPDSGQDLIGGIAVHPVDQSEATRASFMADSWPKCLQLSSLIPCNVTNIMQFCRNMQVPFFLVGTPQSIPDPATNSKVVTSILSKVVEKAGVVKIEISVNGNNNHGLLLFRFNGRLLGAAFFKMPLPDLKAQATPASVQPPQPAPTNNVNINTNPTSNPVPQLNPQLNAAFSQPQQAMSAPAMNQNVPINMNNNGFNHAMAQNMAASGALKNNQAMAMFGGMPMNLANQAQNSGAGVFMNNPGMVNPAMAMYNMDAQRRAQANGGINPFNSMPPGMNMQQFNQMQQNQGNYMLPQQLQQMAQMQLAQRQQAARPPNPRNPPQ